MEFDTSFLKSETEGDDFSAATQTCAECGDYLRYDSDGECTGECLSCDPDPSTDNEPDLGNGWDD